MNPQSLMVRTLDKLIFPIIFVLLVVYINYAVIMGKSFFILILIAVPMLALLLKRTPSRAYNFAAEILLLSVYIIFATYLGIAALAAESFVIIMIFVGMLLPVFFTRPKVSTYIFIGLLLFFTNVAVGMRESFNYYSRGEGLLPFNLSFVEIFIWIISFSIIIQVILGDRRFKSGVNIVPCNMNKYFLAFIFIFGFYVIWGVATGVPPSRIFHRRGVINVINMAAMVFVMLYVFKTERSLDQFKKFFIIFAVCKAIWAFLRFFFLKGDPTNMYAWATIGGVPYGIKRITAWDIAENLIFGIAAFYLLWTLSIQGERLSRNKKLLFFVLGIICIFDIAFSYRRAAWGGLAIIIGWFFLCLPIKKRVVIGIPTVILCVFLLSAVIATRAGGVGVFHDIKSKESGDVTVKEGRFVELFIAWQSVKHNPLFGLGPWGKYKQFIGYSEEELYLPPNDLVHSGIGHMVLKMGLIGGYLLISFFYKYFQFWLKKRKELSSEIRGFAEASFAGVLFLIPEFLFAGPIVEFRTMVLLGICFAIPYISYYVYCQTDSMKNFIADSMSKGQTRR